MTIELRGLTPAAEGGWATLFDLAEEDLDSWVLVGGQMMLVIAIERGAEYIRPTEDMDVVVNLRVRPKGISWMSDWLQRRNFELEGMSPDFVGHRFVREVATGLGKVKFDVLAHTGVGSRVNLTTVHPAHTVQAPGALQAFKRSRLLEVLVSDFADEHERFGMIRCPDMLGALVAKAAATSIAVRENPERDWQDAALLLSVLDDPLSARQRCVKRDVQHLNRLLPLLNATHSGWSNLSGEARRTGTAALSFLIEG